jgi:hypothetical protein
MWDSCRLVRGHVIEMRPRNVTKATTGTIFVIVIPVEKNREIAASFSEFCPQSSGVWRFMDDWEDGIDEGIEGGWEHKEKAASRIEL